MSEMSCFPRAWRFPLLVAVGPKGFAVDLFKIRRRDQYHSAARACADAIRESVIKLLNRLTLAALFMPCRRPVLCNCHNLVRRDAYGVRPAACVALE